MREAVSPCEIDKKAAAAPCQRTDAIPGEADCHAGLETGTQ